ncbi:phosphotransferase family protein [Actinoplanes nipponensis]|uniref:phosphotransferase family protein n=1 Tax=Actinoplanes nipponensis TaxID=135950 RepID=UPI001942D2C4|nr:phosphotransferase [Actinoplanes nipponensis]
MTASFTARLPWLAVPATLHRAVQHCAGAPIIEACDVQGGMSPGPAAVLTLGNGACVFVKAVSKAVNASSYRLYQQEVTVLKQLPAQVPAAQLLSVVEDGEWIALVMDMVRGPTAGPPWTTASVTAAAEACATMANVIAPPGLPTVRERLPDLDGWAHLATDPECLSPWERRRITRLAAAVTGWRHWTSGRHLSHHDVRGDNIIINAVDGRAVLIDWGYGCSGAPWLDRALLAADVMAAGHRDGPDEVRRQAVDLLTGLPADAARFVIAQAGMWRRNSTLPAHPGMPTHRRWQRERATALQPLIDDLLPLITT